MTVRGSDDDDDDDEYSRRTACRVCVRAKGEGEGRKEAINSREADRSRGASRLTDDDNVGLKTTRQKTEEEEDEKVDRLGAGRFSGLARPAIRRREKRRRAGVRPFYRARCVTEKCVGQSR